MNMSMIKGKTVKAPKVTGTSIINHGVRTELEMTPSEYILMDYIYKKILKKEEMNFLSTYKATGLMRGTQEQILNNLVAKGFLYPENANPPKATNKWPAAFGNRTEEFEKFWKIDGVVFWTGSKKLALKRYENLRKIYSEDKLLMQRNAYARYLRLENQNGFDRRVMAADRWLNPANEYYEVDWTKMGDEIEAKMKNKYAFKAEKTETLTEEERKKRYEEDSNE